MTHKKMASVGILLASAAADDKEGGLRIHPRLTVGIIEYSSVHIVSSDL